LAQREFDEQRQRDNLPEILTRVSQTPLQLSLNSVPDKGVRSGSSGGGRRAATLTVRGN
jgi:hypothetical protein